MTDPTGRSFLSYRRQRSQEAALLIAAQHDRGIPTWQDIRNLHSLPTEDAIRRVLADPLTANAVLFITPEIEASPIIREVEVPHIIARAGAEDGFFVVPLAAGGLDYGAAADAASNHLSAHNLATWNMEKVTPATLTPEAAARIAGRVLSQRLRAVHRALPPGEPLRIGLFARREPAFAPGTALAMDWTSRFDQEEAPGEVWRDLLLPALADVASGIRQHAAGREVECFGLPTLPAAMALGCAFLSTGGIGLSWRQVTKARPDQLWSLSTPRVASGFQSRVVSDNASARDIAVLVSVADNVEPLFASTRKSLPPLRAVAHVARSGSYPHLIDGAGEVSDIAFVVQDAMRQARRNYGNIGTVHVFAAVPAGLAVLIGQLFNTYGAVQTYEHVGTDGSGAYRAAALLRPCE
jgi:hypothetical protein